MASLRKRGRVWYYRFVDSDGISRERRGCSDRRETKGMASGCEAEASKTKAGLVDPKALAYRNHEARPIGEHLADFKAALTAKGGTPKHASVTHNRTRRVLELSQVKRVSELSLSKAYDALSKLRGEGLSSETINHHIRAVKAFARWLW